MSSPSENATMSLSNSSTNTPTVEYIDAPGTTSPNPNIESESQDLQSKTVITADLSSAEKPNVRFAVLIGLIEVGQVSNKDVVNNVLNLVREVNSNFSISHIWHLLNPLYGRVPGF